MKISIVGRVNTGKSLLFNRLCSKNISMSIDVPNSTVDYITYEINNITLADTCGLNSLNDFKNSVGEHVLNSDLILYVFSYDEPLSADDYMFINYLYKHKKKIIAVINKCDKKNALIDEYRIPISTKYYVSAEHNTGIYNLKKDLNLIEQEEKKYPIISIIGRCSAGKSTLLNALSQSNRAVVSDQPGTTRDAVEALVTSPFNTYKFVDTAGFQKNKDFLDYIIDCRRHKNLLGSNGIIILCDGEIGLTRIDKQMISEAMKYGKFVILCINKLDNLNEDPIKSFRNLNLPGWMPVIRISAKFNQLGNLLAMVDACYFNSIKTLSVDVLNKWIHKKPMDLRDVNNNASNIKYIVQIKSDPIVIAYFAKHRLSFGSEKFFINNLTKEFHLKGCKVLLRHRPKIEKPKKTFTALTYKKTLLKNNK